MNHAGPEAGVSAATTRPGSAGRTRAGEPLPRTWPWPAIGALAIGLALGAAAVGLGLWGAGLEAATDTVVKSGFPLPTLAMQVAALGLSILYLARHHRRVWPLRAAIPASVFACGLVLALGLGVLYDWAHLALARRDHLYARIVASDRHGMRVRVLDSLGLEISRGGAPVDDENGDCVLRVQPVFGDRPRALVVQQQGCVPETLPIGRREWQSGQPVQKTFTCARTP